jgi:hypothetical protein
VGNRGRLCSAPGIQLLHNGFDVRFHGSDRQSELGGNELIAEPERQLPQNLFLPPGERSLLHPIGHAADDQRPHGHAASVDRAQAVDQILKTATEQHITAYTLLQCTANLPFAGVVRQNHDAMAARARGLDQPQTVIVVRDYNIR